MIVEDFYCLHNTHNFKRANNIVLEGEGSFWKRNIMDWRQAVAHIYELIKQQMIKYNLYQGQVISRLI